MPGLLDRTVFFARFGPCPDLAGTDETFPGGAVADLGAAEVPDYRSVNGFGERAVWITVGEGGEELVQLFRVYL